MIPFVLKHLTEVFALEKLRLYLIAEFISISILRITLGGNCLLTPIITDRRRVASVVNKSTQLKIIQDGFHSMTLNVLFIV